MWSLCQRTHRLGYLGYSLVGGLAISLSAALVKIVERQGHLTPIMWVLFVIVAAAGLWVAIASGVRRLHDIGWSGWWLLLGAVPFLGFVQAVILLLTPSQPVGNSYGPPPGVR